MKITRAQISVALVCAILGLMLAYQFKNAKYLSAIANTMQIEKLQKQIDDSQKQKEELEANINELDKKIDEYEKNAATGNSMVESLKGELDKIRTFAGLTNVQGPGVVITVNPKKTDFSNNTGDSMIDEQTLQFIVNELISSGAEAVSINDQRIVGSTGIRTVGSNISINDVKYSPSSEFIIKAIGDKKTLDNGIRITAGLLDYLQNMKAITPQVDLSDKVLIYKSQKVIKVKYMQPYKEGDK